ncbi:MAG TPA: SMC family ATPase [Vicinamibacteria bacterium]
MRPIKLELEGFTAYRELTVCDFEGADLFVVTGPTGSGKSSLIDALTFALYGSVSRYGNPNLVHPVISQGKLEAKVRFDFSVEDRTYTAVRVVRRTRGGATTREARLESEGRTIAGNADEVTARVREILGLDFAQFTTCVVLPQGEFARFLHDKPADRQDLLTKLLGVGLYEKMGNLARIREAEAAGKAALHGEELERMGELGEETRKAARARVAELEGLRKEIESREPELEALRLEVETLRSEARKLAEEKTLLEGIPMPSDAARFSEKIEAARGCLSRFRTERAEAENALSAAEETLARLPDATGLRALKSQRERLPEAERESEKAQEALERSEKEKSEAVAEEGKTRELLEEARRTLAAHDLRGHLVAGEPCPVCRQVVGSIPKDALPPALGKAEKAASKAERERIRAENAWQEASKNRARAAEKVLGIVREIEPLEEKLGKPVDVASELEAIAAAESRRAQARERVRLARDAERRAEGDVEKLSSEERALFRRFDEARDRVAPLGPPPSDRENLLRAWNELSEWARKELPRRTSLSERASDAARSAESKRERTNAEIASRCLGLQVRVDGRPRDAVVTALAKAEQEFERIEAALERASSLRQSVRRETEEARVAGALGQHLKSTGFERWLLSEAFRRLVTGATSILKELSSGQYSFEYDDRLNFEVIDHRNADERRSARTLSGGETFLASLALALTLAEQTVAFAAEGSARLESLFLDEGFGTLDDETLDVVANAITELGERGRVVGVVTHQQNLAAMIPVQYRVSKNPVTSTVTKVVS